MNKYGREEATIAKHVVELNTIQERKILSTLDEFEIVATDSSLFTEEERKKFLEGNERLRQVTKQISEYTPFFQSIVDEVAFDEAQKEITK